ncbi:MAG: 30S ribosomal protein S18 [Planctomycetota bacterium]
MAFIKKSFPKKKNDKAAEKKKRLKAREVSKCRFCREKAEEIDYKDLGSLQRLVTSQGKHLSRKRSGNCATHQRMSIQALKHARFIALMTFCG